MPKYTTELVPTPPLPHAAPALAAAEAGERVKWETLPVPCKHGKLESCEVCELTAERDAAQADLRAEVEQHIAHIDALRVARAEAEDLIIALSAKTQDAMVDEARAEAAEAERDRLSAELAAVRGAMPDPQMLDMYAEGIEWEGYEASGLRKAAARIRALATAAPTPPAAEAGTGGEASAWGTEAPTEPYGEYWIKMRGEDEPTICDVRPDPLRVFGYCIDDVELWGPELAPPDGWQSALAALDTPQEADHAR